MLEIIAIIAAVIGVAIAVVLVLAANKPDTFSVQRATTVEAPPEIPQKMPSSTAILRAICSAAAWLTFST